MTGGSTTYIVAVIAAVGALSWLIRALPFLLLHLKNCSFIQELACGRKPCLRLCLCILFFTPPLVFFHHHSSNFLLGHL